ncbi:MAG: hypothetical protein K5984_02150 [Bacteroidales bacterium]|nr:hypothetical protein [Bacteroidales bacterium]
MKAKILTLFAVLAMSVSSFANDGLTTTPAADSRITFVGRVDKIDGVVSFDWTGVYARVKFEGNYLAMTVSDTKKNYYNVWIDRNTDEPANKVVSTFGKDSLVVLVSAEDLKAVYGKRLPKTPHNVIISKRTEGEQGTTYVKSFTTAGALLQAEPLKERMIEFVGDSYTCGYGTEGANALERFRPETENQNLAYEAIICRYFDADCFVVAHSGMGIARNYNDNVKGWYMPERYLQTYDMDRESRWDASKSDFKPVMTVILLGANDFSTGRQPKFDVWKSQYITLIKEIKEAYGKDHPILCCSPKSAVDVFAYIKQMVEECGYDNVHYMGFFQKVFSENEYGSDYHPNYEGHKKYAHSIIPYISTLTGWPMRGDIK